MARVTRTMEITIETHEYVPYHCSDRCRYMQKSEHRSCGLFGDSNIEAGRSIACRNAFGCEM